jgi:hypothetical protein
MDPLTLLSAALATATAALTLAGKVWDATPADVQKAEAANWGKLLNNLATFIIEIQTKINNLLATKPPAA